LFGAPWLKDGLFFTTDSTIYVSLTHLKVNDIFEQSIKVWNAPLIYNIFLSKYDPIDFEYNFFG